MQAEIVYKVCDFKGFNWFVFRTKIDLYIIPIKILNQKNVSFEDSLKGALWGLRQFFGNWKPFKNDDKSFLFHLKSYFRSQDI